MYCFNLMMRNTLEEGQSSSSVQNVHPTEVYSTSLAEIEACKRVSMGQSSETHRYWWAVQSTCATFQVFGIALPCND